MSYVRCEVTSYEGSTGIATSLTKVQLRKHNLSGLENPSMAPLPVIDDIASSEVGLRWEVLST